MTLRAYCVAIPEVTELLNAIDAGDQRAAAQLLPLVYAELRQMAAAHMAHERSQHTLQPTALVHEAYLRLVPAKAPVAFANRRHFFAAAAEAMRRILVESARRKRRPKHGGGLVRHDLADLPLAAPEPEEDLVALDESLARFAAAHPIKAELVSLRYFAGLTAAQAAELLGVSVTTADRYWAYARAWLFHDLAEK